MNNNVDLDFKLLEKIVEDWANIYTKTQLHIDFLSAFFSDKSRLLDIEEIFATSFWKQNNTNLSDFKSMIATFSIIKEKEEKLSRDFSVNFNVLDFFSIGETLHSKLLGFFLSPNENHGQKDLFLRKLLEKLDLKYEGGSKWNISIESKRIDILIWREDPFSVVIIENKSNNAVDQKNQIYRYWYKTIYSRFLLNKNNKINFSNFKIIYLVANDGKVPSLQSLKKPEGWSEDLPTSIPQELYPIIWFFSREVTEFLKESLSGISEKNYRLREYINQYIEYWNK